MIVLYTIYNTHIYNAHNTHHTYYKTTLKMTHSMSGTGCLNQRSSRREPSRRQCNTIIHIMCIACMGTCVSCIMWYCGLRHALSFRSSLRELECSRVLTLFVKPSARSMPLQTLVLIALRGKARLFGGSVVAAEPRPITSRRRRPLPIDSCTKPVPSRNLCTRKRWRGVSQAGHLWSTLTTVGETCENNRMDAMSARGRRPRGAQT